MEHFCGIPSKTKQKKYMYIFAKFSRIFKAGDLLTTVSNAEAVGEPDDVRIVSPGCHINEEVRWVLNGEAESESIYTNIWNSDILVQLVLQFNGKEEERTVQWRDVIYSPEEGAGVEDTEVQCC